MSTAVARPDCVYISREFVPARACRTAHFENVQERDTEVLQPASRERMLQFDGINRFERTYHLAVRASRYLAGKYGLRQAAKLQGSTVPAFQVQNNILTQPQLSSLSGLASIQVQHVESGGSGSREIGPGLNFAHSLYMAVARFDAADMSRVHIVDVAIHDYSPSAFFFTVGGMINAQ